MAKKQYTVKQKMAHYGGVLANAEKTRKAAEQAQRQANRVSYAAGYDQAVKDCRAALQKNKK